jgi:hypothetical protein
MTDAGFILVLTNLVLGAIATFLAILVWSRTREAAWVLVVAGVLASYAGIVYSALKLFGLVSEGWLVVSKMRINVAEMIAQNLPLAFFIAALSAFLIRRRLR